VLHVTGFADKSIITLSGDVDNKVKTIFVVDAFVMTSYKILFITKSNLKK